MPKSPLTVSSEGFFTTGFGWMIKIAASQDKVTLMSEDYKQTLLALAEPEYRDFNTKLIPDTPNILGVRLPKLQQLAKRISKEDWRDYLQRTEDQFFEEVLIRAMVVADAPINEHERLTLITDLIPRINNWAACDTLCGRLKGAVAEQELYWEYLSPYFASSKEFELRFSVVMLLCHFINETYLERVLAVLDGIKHDGYYVSMAVAWAVSYCFFKFPERTLAYLRTCGLDDRTYARALQKIIDSHRVDGETKALVKTLRRTWKVNS